MSARSKTQQFQRERNSKGMILDPTLWPGIYLHLKHLREKESHADFPRTAIILDEDRKELKWRVFRFDFVRGFSISPDWNNPTVYETLDELLKDWEVD